MDFVTTDLMGKDLNIREVLLNAVVKKSHKSMSNCMTELLFVKVWFILLANAFFIMSSSASRVYRYANPTLLSQEKRGGVERRNHFLLSGYLIFDKPFGTI